MPSLADVERRLREDTPFYAEHCLHIVNEEAEAVPFVYRPAQLKIERALQSQALRGLPMRVIVLKARRVGSSSSGMAKLTQRTTLMENRQALIVAHDKDTAGELFDLVDSQFYPYLPTPAQGAPDWLKPGIVSRRNNEDHKLLHFGNPGTRARLAGDVGVNSRLRIDTAKEVAAGRGKTITDLWLTEVAFWPNPEKFLSLMNAVFDRPGTMIVVESTANGFNAFKPRVERAQRGEGNFLFVFIGWTDDPEHCTQEFPDPDEEARFVETIGKGEWGEDEPGLIANFGCTPQQLYWRRNTIIDKCDGQLPKFRQEYPSTAHEAFVASGGNVFSIQFTARVLKATEGTEPLADVGVLKAAGYKPRRIYSGEILVPTGAVWEPAPELRGFEATLGYWRVWRAPWKGTPDQIRATRENEPERLPLRPENPGQYIVVGDVASGDGADYHAIQVVDHMTGEQVAEYRSQIDPDLFTEQLFLAGLHWNLAWIAVETTGGYGTPIARGLRHKYGYPRMYMQARIASGKMKQDDRLGWDTNRNTKPSIINETHALLREGTDGIRSTPLALELTTYVRLEDGSLGAASEANDDLYMAWGIAQIVRRDVPARTFTPLPQGRGLPAPPPR